MVVFRHPVLLDRATGKPDRRVRRGLGTKDEKETERLVTELNQLLADRIFWEASSRATALTKFKPIVVDIFYHDMMPESVDSFGIREAAIPLPRSVNSGYRQVLLLGTTGAARPHWCGSSWVPIPGAVPSEDEKQQVFAAVAETISLQLLLVVVTRLRDEVDSGSQQMFAPDHRSSTRRCGDAQDHIALMFCSSGRRPVALL